MGNRIVLTTHGSLGDLHPYFAIALGLQARGHRPVIVTSEYHRRAIEAAGVEFHALRPDVTFQDKALHMRRELGLPPGADPIFEGRHSPQRVLALFSDMIGEPQPDWPANTLVTGFPFYDEDESSLPPGLLQFLTDGEPPIIFTLGSSAVWDAGSFYVESAAAARQLGKRAVLLVGHDPLNHPRALSENVIAVPYAPYAQVFPYASAIVHQGGVGTTGQALRAGKPMLVVPFGGDQYDNGARVACLGVGHVMRQHHYRAERIAVELQRLLENPSYREKAAAVGRKIQEEHGMRAACDAIEKQLQTKN